MMLGDPGHLELAARGGRQTRGDGSTRAAALHFCRAASGTEDDVTSIGNEEHAREEADKETRSEAHAHNVMISDAAGK